ncbi:MAG: class I SAM-dependent methyltransferase [Burkholderiales bacterium]|nr:class I SAM-dependent methyltransferase [Burkholderiales bacterium]
MLKSLIRELRRTLSSRSAVESPVRAVPSKAGAPRAAVLAFLREPLPHPKHINYETLAWLAAGYESAEYMVGHMMGAMNFERRDVLLEYALDQATVAGLVMEFGVYRGESLQLIARRCEHAVHGFDSFEGLPEDWTYYQKKGRFSLVSEPPVFDDTRIHLHKGWFDQTLPQFLARHAEPARFIHVDCDLYSSARSILEHLAARIVPGTVIVFDEYLNYPGWRQHEFRAFQEYVGRSGRSYQYIGFVSSNSSVAVKMA